MNQQIVPFLVVIRFQIYIFDILKYSLLLLKGLECRL